MTRLGRLMALPRADRQLLWRALTLLVVTRWALELLPLATVHRLLDRVARLTAWPRPESPAPDRVAWAVARASTWVPGVRCLSQALAGVTLLRSHGLPGQLRLGLARVDGRVRGHAWVESEGRVVVGGAQFERYTLLPGDGRAAR